MIKKRIIILSLILAILIQEFLLILTYSEAAYTVTHNQVAIEANKNNDNGISAFPESYQVMLKKLVQETGHTNWKFKAFYTDIDWSELTNSNNENRCLRNTIYANGAESTWLCICNQQGDKGYFCASSRIVNYYLDPRNFLSETTIFQFLDLSNSSPVSVANIQSAVAGTYLAGDVDGVPYAEMIYKAAEASGENALSIVVKIFQELGNGTDLPKMISGKSEGYEGVYNFFNYGASDGAGNIVRGLEYAKNAGWTTPEKALVEGAKLIANTYMKTGQNTKYTLKFDVVDDTSNGLFWHQYCTNIQDPNTQAQLLYNRYLNNGWLSNELTFVIPVYKNMPAYVKLPSSLNTDSGTLYFISSRIDNVTLRSGAGTSFSALASLKRNELVVMRDYNINNSGWSQVSNANGVTGYVSNEYLTPVNLNVDNYSVPSQPAPENPQPLPSDEFNGKEFEIKDTNLITEPGTTLGDIKKKHEVKLVDKDGKEITDDTKKLATGMKVTINDETYEVIKLGDCSGDGKVSALDYVRIVNHVMETQMIEGCYAQAADVNRDGKISALDYVRIVNNVMEYSKIEL